MHARSHDMVMWNARRSTTVMRLKVPIIRGATSRVRKLGRFNDRGP